VENILINNLSNHKFYIVDAFAKEPFGGNPAGVVFLDSAEFPPDEIMLKLAAEFRYSETAFVRLVETGIFETRYFTPTAEVDLCGHATIGSFFALLDDGEISNNASYTNRTKAGDLRIDIIDGAVFMEMGAPKLLGGIDDSGELYRIMGSEPPIIPRENNLGAAIVSTGLPDILMPVADESQLEKLTPDFSALAALSEKLGVVGVHAFAIGASDGRIHTRNFAPLFGIDEEAATGTSSGALAYYLLAKGLLREGEEITFIQGESMGRPSEITARAGEKIFVGGGAVVIASGRLK
jgi:PhzF family phenazine biosynthesis protein